MDVRDIISSIVAFLVSVFVFSTSLRLGIGALHDPGPGFILFWASISLAVAAALLFGIAVTKKTGPLHRSEAPQDPDRHNTTIVMAALVVYALLLATVGYLLSTFALMLLLFRLGRMKPWTMLVGSLMTVLLSYCLFDCLLRTPLPRGVLHF